MTVHIVKLAVHCDDIAELKKRMKERAKERGFYCFYTRNTPKRADEVLDGGSVYWVIRGRIEARQRIRGFVPIVNRRGRPAVLVKLEAKITPVENVLRRAFQGWRYLEASEAPADRAKPTRGTAMPPAMERELRDLGLL